MTPNTLRELSKNITQKQHYALAQDIVRRTKQGDKLLSRDVAFLFGYVTPSGLGNTGYRNFKTKAKVKAQKVYDRNTYCLADIEKLAEARLKGAARHFRFFGKPLSYKQRLGFAMALHSLIKN